MLFLDRANPLGKLERTPQGGYVAPAKIARTGVMLYSAKAWRNQGVDVPAKFADSDMLRVYMPAAVLQAAADSLRASHQRAPACDGRPEQLPPVRLRHRARCSSTASTCPRASPSKTSS